MQSGRVGQEADAAPERANHRALAAALRPLIGAIDAETMRAANLRAALGDANAAPEDVARWLWHAISR